VPDIWFAVAPYWGDVTAGRSVDVQVDFRSNRAQEDGVELRASAIGRAYPETEYDNDENVKSVRLIADLNRPIPDRPFLFRPMTFAVIKESVRDSYALVQSGRSPGFNDTIQFNDFEIGPFGYTGSAGVTEFWGLPNTSDDPRIWSWATICLIDVWRHSIFVPFSDFIRAFRGIVGPLDQERPGGPEPPVTLGQ